MHFALSAPVCKRRTLRVRILCAEGTDRAPWFSNQDGRNEGMGRRRPDGGMRKMLRYYVYVYLERMSNNCEQIKKS